MRVLVIGGSGSGKSEYAERLAVRLSGGRPLYYLATMEDRDQESHLRVQRHRSQRQGRGFTTLELPCPEQLDAAPFCGGVALLEDLENLCANTMFGPGTTAVPPLVRLERCLKGLEDECSHLVVVTSDLGRAWESVSPETRNYLELLRTLQGDMAQRFEGVVEVVCGLPVYWKGRFE